MAKQLKKKDDTLLVDTQGTRWFAPNPDRAFFPLFWVGTSVFIIGYWLREPDNPPVLLTGVWDQ